MISNLANCSIAGIGVDITRVSRIEKVHNRFGERFARRFLSESELQHYRTHNFPTNFLAKRFAAKEAAVKALGTGERGGVLLKDFYVTHDNLGKPQLQVAGVAEKMCIQRNISGFHVSLSDEGDQVIAFVILEHSPTTQAH